MLNPSLRSAQVDAGAPAATLHPLEGVRDGLVAWLVNEALPRWAGTGTDRVHGGFFEKIDLQGAPVEELRRTRVVARQIYVFATAARHGWLGGTVDLVEHGLDFLLRRLQAPDGSFNAAVRPDGSAARREFDLYEHAFALFALASVQRLWPQRHDFAERAARVLTLLRAHWGHDAAGFHESRPASAPLKSNPHMHLLEAARAWEQAAPPAATPTWQALADELAHLCLSRFIDPSSGALREYFGLDWRPMPGPAGRVVEPGHQFEWGWLLAGWGRERVHAEALGAARRLVLLGERHGVDATRQVAINELRDDFAVVDPNAKLWPQTERVKAWCAMTDLATTAADACAARERVASACAGMSRYLLAEPSGLWHESMLPDGSFRAEACRASSLYHIVCAIETLHGLVQSGGGVGSAPEPASGPTAE